MIGGVLAPGLNAEEQAIGFANEESAFEGVAGRLIAHELEDAIGGSGLLPGEDPGGVGADLFLAGERDAQILLSAFAEGENDGAVVGGDIDEAVLCEFLKHALADAIVGGFDAEGERMTGSFGALDFSTVDGDHLAELDECVVGATL